MSRRLSSKYTEPGRPVEQTIATGSGSSRYAALDRFDRVIKLRWQQSGKNLIDYDYTYDRVDNRLTQKVNNTPVNSAVDELYGYDPLYRLTDYDRGDLVSGSISNATLTQDWTLDETGNWTAFDQGVAGSVDQTRSHNKANEITDIDETGGASWPTPTYDANGNMTSMPQPANLASGYDATLDAWNRLVKLEDGSNVVAEYQYDGLNRRIIRKIYAAGTLDHTRHLYLSSQNQVLEERIDSSTDAAQQFVWGIRFVDDLVLRDRDTNSDGTLNERLYALHDMRFSILAITNSGGTVQERFVYSAFGTSSIFSANYDARSSSSYDWEYRYTGRRHDLESKLHYFRARYYHAENPRWLLQVLGNGIPGHGCDDTAFSDNRFN